MALLAVAFVLPFVTASGDLDVDIEKVVMNGVDLDSKQVVNYAGETVPIRIEFTAGAEDVDNAKLRVWIGGYRGDVSETSRRLNLVEGGTYSEKLSLTLPSDIDQSEEYTLYVRIETKTDYVEEEYNLRLQREAYDVDILDIDFDRSASAGSNVAVDIVLKNIGYDELEDIFVIARIPELGVERKAYFEDLNPTDDCEIDELNGDIVVYDCDDRDSAERRIYLRIPANAVSGMYTLEVEAYNKDTEAVVSKSLVIVGAETQSEVLVAMPSKDIARGQEVTYEVIIVNSGNSVKVYEIVPETATNLVVTVNEPIVTVSPDSSKTVKITVKAVGDEGTYNFAINVNSGGDVVKRVNLVANVSGRAIGASNIVVLTIVLAIIFIVLLVVLIVLLTRKPERTEEEFGESYY